MDRKHPSTRRPAATATDRSLKRTPPARVTGRRARPQREDEPVCIVLPYPVYTINVC